VSVAERRLLPPGSTSLVCVDDTGTGVTRDHRDRMFSYGQRENTLDGVRGKSVGLAIVDRVRGRIDVTDSHLGGARFMIALRSIDD